MTQLCTKSCVPCEGGVPPLDADQVASLSKQVPDWQVAADRKSIARTFEFENYYRTMAFVNAVAWMAHTEDHHPDLSVHYGKCEVTYSTHAIDGLSENDFICAAKVDALLAG